MESNVDKFVNDVFPAMLEAEMRADFKGIEEAEDLPEDWYEHFKAQCLNGLAHLFDATITAENVNKYYYAQWCVEYHADQQLTCDLADFTLAAMLKVQQKYGPTYYPYWNYPTATELGYDKKVPA